MRTVHALLIHLHIGLGLLYFSGVDEAGADDSIQLAQSDEQRRQAEEERRRQCERNKSDTLARCLSNASSGFYSCESGCSSSPDPFACRDRCRSAESSNRSNCHSGLSGMSC